MVSLMDTNIENLRQLLDEVRNIGLWTRLFGWKRVKDLLIDATSDLQKLLTGGTALASTANDLSSANLNLAKDLAMANEIRIRQASAIEQLESANKAREENLLQLTRENSSQRSQIDAGTERILRIEGDIKLLEERNGRLTNDNRSLFETVASNSTEISGLTENKRQLEIDLTDTRSKLSSLQNEVNATTQKLATLQAEEDSRRQRSEKAITDLSIMKEQTQRERQDELEKAKLVETDRLTRLKETWNRHQDSVKEKVKGICMTHTIEYVDKVPFRGEPDNTIKICGEYIVFDSKSPANEDLANFPIYLNTQSENAKKYAKQAAVKSVIFFVVPSNTLESLKQYVYNLGDYDVHVIAADSLEQIILGLKKIEEYEFAEALSPEDRDNICRILAKFAHLTKRRIQIDSFFARQFIEMVFKSEAELPREFLDKIVEYEKSEKLNPPTDRRTKIISTRDLSDDTLRLQGETISRGINLAQAALIENLNSVQLYENPSDTSALEIVEGG